MTPANKIWIDGKTEPIEKANFLNFHQGLNYGACVYDGIRFYKTSKGPAVFRLKDHLDRFYYSASVLNMDLGIAKEEFVREIIKLIKANDLDQGYLRPMAFYSEPKMGINIFGAKITVVIFVWPWRDDPREKLVTMKIVEKRRLDPNTVDLKAKISGYYSNGLLGFIEAKKEGFDEPLFLDIKGFIAEGAVNNIFIIRENALYTPTTRNVLAGVTRDTVIQIAKDLGIKVYEKDLRPEFLKTADEIFLTGTGIELERVIAIKDYYSQKDSLKSNFKIIQDRYKEVVLGNAEAYKNWLTQIV